MAAIVTGGLEFRLRPKYQLMNIFEKLKLLKAANKAMEVLPVDKLWSMLSGRKTYVGVLAWVVYKAAVNHGWLQPMPDLEVAILGWSGLAARDAIGKKA